MLIAEIGINHNGHLNNVISLIDMAIAAGWDVVKFQKRDPDICVPEDQKFKLKIWEGEEMTYLDYKKKIEFGKEEYDYINAYCKKNNIKWAVSVWDIPSANFIIDNYANDIAFLKIPSACITDMELIEHINKRNRNLEFPIPIFASGGMSTSKEVGNCVLQTYNLQCFMHCNSSYPAHDNELDLAWIPFYIADFEGIRFYGKEFEKLDLEVGYSGHEIGVKPSAYAYAMGAKHIERHITLDNRMEGSDHKASITLKEMIELKEEINYIDMIKGLPRDILYPDEIKAKEKLRKNS